MNKADMEIRTCLTRRDLFVGGFCNNMVLRFNLIVGLFGGFFAAVGPWGLGLHELSHLPLAVLPLTLLWGLGFAAFASVFGAATAAFRRGPLPGILGEHTFILSAAGLSESTAIDSTQRAWSDVTRVMQVPAMGVLLRISGGSAYILPARSFASGEQQEACVAYIKQAMRQPAPAPEATVPATPADVAGHEFARVVSYRVGYRTVIRDTAALVLSLRPILFFVLLVGAAQAINSLGFEIFQRGELGQWIFAVVTLLWSAAYGTVAITLPVLVRLLEAVFKPDLLGEYAFSISPQGLTLKYPSGSTSFRWQSVREIRDTSSGRVEFIFHNGNNRGMPASAFRSRAERASFVKEARAWRLASDQALAMA